MNVFLTGATGYIGSVIAERLQAAGHQVTGLARSNEAAAKLQARGVTMQRGNLREPKSLAKAAHAADAVIHAAAPADGVVMDFSAIVAATQAMLDALDGTGKPFIYTSGTGSYGDTGTAEVDEDSPTNVPTFMSPWVESEQAVLNAGVRNIRSIVIRPGIVYGRGGSGPVVGLLGSARQAGVAYYINAGENRLSSVHVDDLADLYLLALEHAPASTLLNAVAGPAVSTRELAEAISYAAGLGGITASLLLEQARQQMGDFFANFYAHNMQVSVARAIRLLGWHPYRPSILDDLRHGSYSRKLAAT